MTRPIVQAVSRLRIHGNILLASLIIVCLLIPASAVSSNRASNTIFFDDFHGQSLKEGWIVENLGGNYSLDHGVLTLSSSGPAVTVYRQFTPQTDNFTIAARVESRLLASFALRIQASSPPIFGSTVGAQLEFDTGKVENKNFLAAWEPLGGGWIWSTFYVPSTINTWFVLEMKVQRSPFTITYSVYNSTEDNNGHHDDQGQISDNEQTGGLLGTFVTTAHGFSYDSIRYVALEAWSASLIYNIDWVRISASNVLLSDDFTKGQPTIQDSGSQSTWSGRGLWTLNNVDGSTMWFPRDSIARFNNFQFSFPPAVSLNSKGQWIVGNRLVLLEHLRAWNFTNLSGGFAWQTALEWGAGSAVMGYGRDDAHTPNTGVLVGGQCTENQPGSVLTAGNFLGEWLTANITLSGPTQTMYFSIRNSDGVVLGQTSSSGYCGTMFGTLPVHVQFFTSFGTADVDWITLTS